LSGGRDQFHIAKGLHHQADEPGDLVVAPGRVDGIEHQCQVRFAIVSVS
jgi:hypothetical protein